MKITSIDVIPIYPRLAKRYEDRKVDLYGIDARTVFRVTTDSGIVGYGDQRVRPHAQPEPSVVERFVGSSPFDFMNSGVDMPHGLVVALYDAMGKHLEMPVHKLLGHKCRDAVPVAAWTRPAAPEHFRDEIARAAGQGYRIFKMHTSSNHDVFEQTRLAEEVAPDGFRIHYDFNGKRTLAASLPIIAEMERNHPIVGYIEDPLLRTDVDGWRTLRQQTRLPIIMHGTRMGGMQEMMAGMADIYMIGGTMAETMATGFAYGQANIQVLLQYEGGTLGKAMAMHMASVLPTHTAHSINLDDQYEDDITTERIPVVEGSSPVPDGPGLGYEVDEEALSRLAAQELVEPPRHVGVLRMPDGHTYYGKSYVSPDTVTGKEEGTVRGFRSEIWEEDGSSDFEEMYQRVQAEGVVRVG